MVIEFMQWQNGYTFFLLLKVHLTIMRLWEYKISTLAWQNFLLLVGQLYFILCLGKVYQYGRLQHRHVMNFCTEFLCREILFIQYLSAVVCVDTLDWPLILNWGFTALTSIRASMFGNILDCQDPGDLVTWVGWVDCRIAAKFLVLYLTASAGKT